MITLQVRLKIKVFRNELTKAKNQASHLHGYLLKKPQK